MKHCYYCRGDLVEGTATLDKKHEGQHYQVEDVPARICSNCGERYFNSTILIAIEDMIDSEIVPYKELEEPIKVYKYKVA